MLFANIVLAVATVVLVGVTWYYAWQTGKMVSEMQKQRKDAALAFVSFRHSAFGDQADPNKAARHWITNSGPGTALGICAEVTITTGNGRNEEVPDSRLYRIAALGPNGDHEIFIGLANVQIVGFRADYVDLYGRSFSVEQAVKGWDTGDARYLVDGRDVANCHTS